MARVSGRNPNEGSHPNTKLLQVPRVHTYEAVFIFAGYLGERFHRLRRYYLLSCAGAFRARNFQLWQWTLSKHGLPGGYPRVS